MAGHSKWNNIKNRKGAVDRARSKVFSQLTKLIRVAVKEGQSGDPKFNASLRVLLDKARLANMPKDKVQRAIDNGLGKSAGVAIQEVIYEAFGPGGVAMLIVTHTNNHQRTSADIKFILSRGGGSLGGPGSAMYMFKRNGEEYEPTMKLEISDESTLNQLQELVDNLSENEDVEEVYLSADLPVTE